MWPPPTGESVSNFSISMCYIYYVCKLHSATQFTCLSNTIEVSWLRLESDKAVTKVTIKQLQHAVFVCHVVQDIYTSVLLLAY